MKEDQRFPITQWSVVIAAQGAKSPNARQALERLFETYWFPVYAFIRSRTANTGDAEDLTQGFFMSLFEHCSLDPLRPELGRFRAFLLASAKHYMSAEHARGRAQKRGGGQALLPLDFVSADQRYRFETSRQENPDAQFERQWALAAFEAAAEKLRRQFATEGKAIHFEAFRPFLIPGEEPKPHAELAAALEMTEAAAKVAIHRARRRFGRLLRDEIAQTVAASGTGADKRAIEDEVRYLFRLLSP